MQKNSLKQAELLSTQSNVEENQSKEPSSELIHREDVENTPFQVVGNDEKGWIITIGRFKLTENRPTKIEALQELQIRPWAITLRLITTLHEAIMIKIGEELMQENNNNNKNQNQS